MAALVPDIPVVERQIVAATNAFRAGQKLSPLVANPALAAAARVYADYLARTGKFAHGADGKTQDIRAREQGYQPCQSAENLALHSDSRGFVAEALGQTIVEGWKSSPGHRANLVLSFATELGVAVARVPGPVPKYVSVQLIARPQRLEQRFKIENRAGVTVAYTVGGRRTEIKDRMTVTHKTCTPVDVVVHVPGNGWFGGTKDHAVKPGPDFVLTLAKGEKSGVAVTTKTEKAEPTRKP